MHRIGSFRSMIIAVNVISFKDGYFIYRDFKYILQKLLCRLVLNRLLEIHEAFCCDTSE